MKKILFALITSFVLITGVAVIGWFSLDERMRCTFIYGKNICNFYAVMESTDFNKMIALCAEMSDVPKKDSCFEFVAQTFAHTDENKAREACDYVKGFDNVHSREDCHALVK